jgi:hypothetical protein
MIERQNARFALCQRHRSAYTWLARSTMEAFQLALLHAFQYVDATDVHTFNHVFTDHKQVLARARDEEYYLSLCVESLSAVVPKSMMPRSVHIQRVRSVLNHAQDAIA